MITFGDFKRSKDCGYFLYAAEDIPGFCKKGRSLYGNCDDMLVSEFAYIPSMESYEIYLKRKA